MGPTQATRLLLGAAALGAVLAALTPTPAAHADNSNEVSYINDLQKAGLIVTNRSLALADGYRVCLEANQGWTWSQGARQLMVDNNFNISFAEAMREAQIAKLDLC